MFQLVNIYYLVKAVECLQMITSTKWKESIPSRLSLNTAPITSKKRSVSVTHTPILDGQVHGSQQDVHEREGFKPKSAMVGSHIAVCGPTKVDAVPRTSRFVIQAME